MVKDREAWCATVHRVARRRTWLSDWTTTYHHPLQTPASADMQVLHSSLVSADEELIDSKGGRYTRDWSGWSTYYRPCIRTIFTIVWVQVPPPPQKKRVINSLPANVGDVGDTGSIPGLGRSPGGGNGNLLQYSCLENPMAKGAWRATVPGVARSQTRLSN